MTKEQRKVYDLQRYHKFRKEVIVFLGGRCSKCESTIDLHIHHIDPTLKKFTIAKSWTNKAKVFREIEKCVLLCSQCHKKRHQISAHGISMYVHRKCRCDVCVEAHRAYYRQCKANKRPIHSVVG